MAILNMITPIQGGGGAEVKEESFSVTTLSQNFIGTIFTDTIPSWYVLVGRDYNTATTYYVVKSVISIDGVTAAHAYISKGSSSSRTEAVEETITPTITSRRLRFTVTGSSCYFYGNYTLYYID